MKKLPKKKKAVPDVEMKTQEKETKASETEKTEQPQPIKLPSREELMRNPMKYIGQAVQAFQEVSVMVAENRQAVLQIAEHIKSSDKKLLPLVSMLEKAQKDRAQAQASGQTLPQGSSDKDLFARVLMGIVSGGGGGGMSETDKWLRDVGRDTVGLGNMLYREFIKEMVPNVIAKWEKRKEELAGQKKD